MLYIFDKDDNFKNIITEDTGLIDTWFKDYQNHLIDEPFKFHVESKSELLPLLKEENQVAFYDRANRLRMVRLKEPFEIYQDGEYVVEFMAEPSWLELYDHFIEDRRVVDGEAQTALNRALDGSRYTGEVQVELGLNTTNFYWIDAVKAIFKIIDTWGGSLVDTIELDENNEIIERKILIVERLGRDNGLLIQPGYNAETIERRTLSYPVTAIWGQGASFEIEDEEGNHTGGYTRYITFEDVEWSKAKGDPVDKPKGQKWVGDPDALVKYGYKQVDKVYLLDYTTLEIGTLTSNTGNETSAPGNNRIRSGFIDFVDSQDIVIDAIPSTDIQINVYSYDSNERFISHSNYVNLSNNIEYTLPVNARYVRFVFKTINNDTIIVSDVRDISIRFNFFDIMHRFGHFSNQDYETPEELLYATWEALQKEKEPEVYHEAVIDEVDKPIFLGDTGTILDRHYGKPIEVQSQITGLEYDILRPTENVKTVLGNYKDMSRDPLEDEIDEIKKEQSRPPIINDNSFPDVKPGTPVNVEAVGMFRAILVSWEYDSKIYMSHYEVYASQTADFVPDAQFLVYRGRVSSFGHEVGSNETWYYRVRAVNTHGTTSEFSVQVSASSTRIDFIDMEDEIKQEIQDAKDRAEEAYDNANLATQNAIDAIDKAQQGFDKAQDAITQAGTANTKADQSISQAQSAFNKAQESLDGLSTLVGITDEQGKELTSIKGSVQGLQASVTDLDDNVATLQMTSQSLAGRLTDAEGNLTSVSATVQGLQTQVSDVEGNVSTVTQLANVLERRITDSEGNISSLQSTASSLSSRIGEIEDWEIGGRNLMEGTSDKLRSVVFGGWTGSFSPTGTVDVGFDNVLQPNDEAVASVFIKSGNQRTALLLNEHDGSTRIRQVTGNYIPANQEGYSIIKFKVSSNATRVILQLRHDSSDTPSDTKYYKELLLVKGNKATDWSPAPEDTDQKFSAIDQTIDSIATRVQTNADNYSSMTQTVQGIQNTVANKADKSTVTQLAGVVDTKISTVDANNKFATQSQLTQTASSLTSTISSVKNELEELEISETNLALNSNTKVNSTAYRITGYDLTLDWVAGEKWTVVVKGELNEGQRFGIWANGSSSNQVYTTDLGNGYHRATFTVKKPVNSGTNSGTKIMNVYNYPSATAQFASIEWVKLVRAEKTSLSWSPAPEDMATQSQISQLSDAINLRVKEDELITQINLDKSGILISGKKLILDGDTTVTGNFRVNNANIVSVDAGKMTTGTLDASRVNVININANNITSGTIDTDLLTVRGGSTTEYAQIDGAEIETRGKYTRTWFGETKTHDVGIQLRYGRLRFHNYENQRNLYFSETGISTYISGSNEDDDGQAGSGVIEFFSYMYNDTIRGLTMYSNRGHVALRAATRDVILDANRNVHIYSNSGGTIIEPHRDLRSGRNSFYFGVKSADSAADTDGYITYGSLDQTTMASGIRFKKSRSGEPLVWATDGSGSPATGSFYGKRLYGELYPRGTYNYLIGERTRIMHSEAKNAYGGLQVRNIQARSIRINLDDSSTRDNFYVGVSTGELRVVTNQTIVDGMTTSVISYRPVRARSFIESSSRMLKTDIKAYEENAMDVIRSLTVVNYRFKDDVERGVNLQQIGFISEDSPAIATADNMAIQTTKLASYLTKGLQETDIKINLTREELILKISKLEERIIELESAA